jgi:predicted Zn finger-like uncharacterized protein
MTSVERCGRDFAELIPTISTFFPRENLMPIQTTCPSCNKPLRVPDSLIGKNVKCPSCQTTFVVEVEGGESPPPLPRESRRDEGIREETPSRRPARDEEDEDDRPSRRPVRRDDDDYQDDDRGGDEDFDEERPRRRRRRRRRSEPHRGGTVLGFGIASIIFALCCPLVGIILGAVATILGGMDLSAMGAGRKDDSGRGQTMGGLVCGIIGIILGIINAILGVMFQMGKFK